MRICFISEGSYPYVTGGVSSWINMIIKSMSENEFIVISINSSKKKLGKYKYEIPTNLIKIYDINFDLFETFKVKSSKFVLCEEGIKSLESLILSNHVLNSSIFKYFDNLDSNEVFNFYNGMQLFNIIKNLNKNYFPEIPFNGFYWSIRSMLLPIFTLMAYDLPYADVYHSSSTGYSGFLASIVKNKYQKPLIISEHGIYTREREEEIFKSTWIDGIYKEMWINFFHNVCKISYLHADLVTSLFTRNKLLQIELGCNPEKIKIIPNGVNTSNFQNKSNKFDDGYIHIGAILRIVPIKDIKTMIQAFSLVKKVFDKTKFYIMGPYDENPDYYNDCIELVEILNIKDIIFTGQINTDEYLPFMDLIVLSSISEGQPLSILEAMACGKPFVSTDVGCLNELAYGDNDDIGEAGQIVPIMDYKRLSESIIELIKNTKKRNLLGLNGRHRAIKNYDFDKFINNYRDIYKEVNTNGRNRI